MVFFFFEVVVRLWFWFGYLFSFISKARTVHGL